MDEDKYQALLAAEASFWDQQIPDIPGFRPDIQYLGTHVQVDPSQVEEIWDDPKVESIARGPLRERIYTILETGPGSRVLELGCGFGWLAVELARRGFHVKGIDISPRRIAIAEAYARVLASALNGGSLEYEMADLNRLCLEPESLDGVVAWDCLHHMVDIEHVIGEVTKALRPGAPLLAFESLREPGQVGRFFYSVFHLILPTREPYCQKLPSFRAMHSRITGDSGPSRVFSSLLSPLDGYTGYNMMDTIRRYLEIREMVWKFAFCGPLLGRLRGGRLRFALVRAVERFDTATLKLRLLPGTHVFVHAVKPK